MEDVIKNCPAREDIYTMTDEFDDNALPVMELKEKDFCVKHGKSCFKEQDCVIKRIEEAVIETAKKLSDNSEFREFADKLFKILGIGNKI